MIFVIGLDTTETVALLDKKRKIITTRRTTGQFIALELITICMLIVSMLTLGFINFVNGDWENWSEFEIVEYNICSQLGVG